MTIYAVDQLRHEGYQIEINFVRRDRPPIPNVGRYQVPLRNVHVSELDSYEDDQTAVGPEDVNVEEAWMMDKNRNLESGGKLRCWNCQEDGHVFKTQKYFAIDAA